MTFGTGLLIDKRVVGSPGQVTAVVAAKAETCNLASLGLVRIGDQIVMAEAASACGCRSVKVWPPAFTGLQEIWIIPTVGVVALNTSSPLDDLVMSSVAQVPGAVTAKTQVRLLVQQHPGQIGRMVMMAEQAGPDRYRAVQVGYLTRKTAVTSSTQTLLRGAIELSRPHAMAGATFTLAVRRVGMLRRPDRENLGCVGDRDDAIAVGLFSSFARLGDSVKEEAKNTVLRCLRARRNGHRRGQ